MSIRQGGKWLGIILGCGALLNLAPAITYAQTGGAPGTAIPVATAKALLDHKFPRLVIVLSFDQFRQDHLVRYSDQFLPAEGADGKIGGFRWLQEKGGYFLNAHYQHVPMHTGPGHAVILTGAPPAATGIIGNDWPTSSGVRINCVQDDDAQTVGSEGGKPSSSSAKNLMVSTVGDELKLGNNRQSKVVGIAIKDRAAILLTGHNPDACIWFDAERGNWVTSTYYSNSLPKFAEQANKDRLPDQWVGRKWELLLPEAKYARSHVEHIEGQGDGRKLGNEWPKDLTEKAEKEYWYRLTSSPFGNEMTFQMGELAIDGEGLGQDEFPDMLCMNFSSTDIAGHSYGAHSAENQDMFLRADQQLSAFLNRVREKVPGGLDEVVVVVTGDHGIAPLPEWTSRSMKMPGGRLSGQMVHATAATAVKDAFNIPESDKVVRSYSDPYIYLDPSKIPAGAKIEDVRKVIATEVRKLHGVYDAYTRDQIENGDLPDGPVSTAVYNGFNMERSGDVVVVPQPFWYAAGKLGVSHTAPYSYDTHVPLIIAGKYVRGGMFGQTVSIMDIAPTLSVLVGCEVPSNSRGRVLSEIF